MKRVALTVLVSVIFVHSAIAQRTLVADVRAAIGRGDLTSAERMARERLGDPADGPVALEALSWVARGALAAGDLDRAQSVGRETERLAEAALGTRRLDSVPGLPTAIGASLEVQAQVLASRGARSDGVYLLTRALERYADTSIHARLQKNIHLLSLVGTPAVALDTPEFLGPERATVASLKGHPLVLFFWAHWCPDCKLQGPILAKLQAEFASSGLRIIAPTQRYGYAAEAAKTASPEEERAHILAVRERYYPDLAGVPIPFSQENFKRYGVSSTPTLVLVDRNGLVRLYNPGRMSEEALRLALRVLTSDTR
jgi:thiol-disulfide isomerase/thioredoxin